MWLEVARPTPLLNTPDFRFAFGGKTGSQIPLNEKVFEFESDGGVIIKVGKNLWR